MSQDPKQATSVSYHAILHDGHWLAHRYDPGADAVQFVRLSRADHATATFVTDEHLPADRRRIALRRAEMGVAMPSPAPLHLILHSAFCCSTLVARALDVPGIATALKEPVLLNDIVGCRRQGIDGARLTTLLRDALSLLSRPLASGESVIVKPSNVVNVFAPAMMAMRPDAHALLLHAPLRVFLTSVARKSMWGRLWVRELFASLLADGLVDMGFTPVVHLTQTDLQIAAVGWLVQQALFGRLHALYGSARVRSIDSETLMQRPAEAMRAIGELFSLSIDVDAIVSGPAFRTDSKTGKAFGSDDRAAEYRGGAALHADEIDKVAIWADAVARTAGIPMTLPGALIA